MREQEKPRLRDPMPVPTDFGIEGPFARLGATAVRLLRWLRFLAAAGTAVWCLSFIAGVLLRHFHVL